MRVWWGREGTAVPLQLHNCASYLCLGIERSTARVAFRCSSFDTRAPTDQVGLSTGDHLPPAQTQCTHHAQLAPVWRSLYIYTKQVIYILPVCLHTFINYLSLFLCCSLVFLFKNSWNSYFFLHFPITSPTDHFSFITSVMRLEFLIFSPSRLSVFCCVFIYPPYSYLSYFNILDSLIRKVQCFIFLYLFYLSLFWLSVRPHPSSVYIYINYFIKQCYILVYNISSTLTYSVGLRFNSYITGQIFTQSILIQRKYSVMISWPRADLLRVFFRILLLSLPLFISLHQLLFLCLSLLSFIFRCN